MLEHEVLATSCYKAMACMKKLAIFPLAVLLSTGMCFVWMQWGWWSNGLGKGGNGNQMFGVEKIIGDGAGFHYHVTV